MCSIWGAILYTTNDEFSIARKFTQMAVSSEDRGRDGTGAIIIYSDGMKHIFKSSKTASDCKDQLQSFFETHLVRACHNNLSCIVVGNNRYQPMAQPDSGSGDDAIQPLYIENLQCVGSHNGTFPEDDLLFKKYGFRHYTGIDSEVLLHLYKKKLDDVKVIGKAKLDDGHIVESFTKSGTEKFLECIGAVETLDREVAIQSALEEIAGGFAFALVDLQLPTCLYLFRNFKPLTVCYLDHEDCTALLFNSEKKNIYAFLREAYFEDDPVGNLFDQSVKFQEVPPYTGMTFTTDGPHVREWQLSNKILAHLPNINRSRKRVLVIASGGMDSSLATAIARKIEGNEVTLLHMNYGQRAYEREKEAVKKVAYTLDCEHVEVDTSVIGKWHTNSPLVIGGEDVPIGMRSAESTLCWVSARNLVFLTMAAAYAESKGFQSIYSGFNLEEAGAYPDNTTGAFKSFEQACEYFTLTRVKMKLAIARMMKPSIIRLAHHLGVPMGFTWSCDTAGYGNDSPEKIGYSCDQRIFIPCGTCGCCWTRRLAYAKAGIEDPQAYAHQFEGPLPEWYTSGKFKVDKTPITTLIESVKSQL